MSDVFDLAPRPAPPDLPGTVVLRPSPEELNDALASDLLIHAHNCVRSFGDFHLALSGGSTPMPLYRCLMTDPRYRELPWKRTHIWIVDERRVPFDDDRSNFKAINEILGDHSDIPRDQLHPVFAMADDADVQYENQLREALAWREPGHDRLDFALLGMGSDGHTASLFPHSDALDQEQIGADRLVVINEGPNVTPPGRVTMTYHMINAARFIAVLVTGAGKRETIASVVDGGDPRELPILGIQPLGGTLRWYLDHEAVPEASDT